MLMQAASSFPEASAIPGYLDRVRDVFVRAVRYPAEVFESPESDLENDLGIDSVMFGVVWLALKGEFDISDEEAQAVRSEPERFRTLGGIAAAIQEIVERRPGHGVPAPSVAREIVAAAQAAIAAVSEPMPADALPIVPTAPRGNVLETVIHVFADVTRYPSDVLTPDADIENDLGIDSVKWGVILNVLRDRLAAPPASEWDLSRQRTIGAVAEFIEASHPAPPQPTEVLSFTPAATASAPVTVPATVQANTRRFEGKIALVTGSGRSLGRSIVMALAEQGAEVIVNSFHSREEGERTTAEIVAAGGKARHVWGSVANVEHLNRIYDEIEQGCGGLDFLVNNASNGLMGPYADIKPEHMERAYATNVLSLHVGAMRAAEMMKRRGGGRIISMSSVASQGYVAYNTCMGPVKAAVESLTRYLAVDLAPFGIRVNCIKVGPIYGDVIDRWPDRSIVKSWEHDMAGGRLLEDADVVETAMFLLGCSGMMNGSVVTLDGGFTLRHIGKDEAAR